jgi:hypothetical protein
MIARISGTFIVVIARNFIENTTFTIITIICCASIVIFTFNSSRLEAFFCITSYDGASIMRWDYLIFVDYSIYRAARIIGTFVIIIVIYILIITSGVLITVIIGTCVFIITI